MTSAALKAGFYHSIGWNKDYPHIQILTIEELLHNAEVKMLPRFGTFKQAQRVQQEEARQGELGLPNRVYQEKGTNASKQFESVLKYVEQLEI